MSNLPPLGLPPGSVRALLALGVVVVWSLLKLGVMGLPVDAPDEMVVVVLAGYGLMRHQQERQASDA